MPKIHYKLLSDTQFVFKLSNDKQWEEKFIVYKDFKTQFSREPRREEEYNGVKIGWWYEEQKSAYNKNELLPERLELLFNTGFKPTTIRDIKWNKNFALYKDFKLEFGREPQRGDVYKGINIRVWCDTQRKGYKNGKLSKERIECLSGAEFPFQLR